MRLSSTQHPAVKYVRSLERAAVRRSEGVFLIEGVRLVREAQLHGAVPTLVLYDAAALQRAAAGRALLPDLATWGHQVYEVQAHVLSAVAQTETPAGVVAVVPKPSPRILGAEPFRLGVVMDGVSDPGNAGTILRTADAAGVAWVASLPGTVDLFAPKVVRAGMGAHFRLPLHAGIEWSDITHIEDATLVAASAHGEHSLLHFQWPQRAVLVVGSEAHGISEEVRVSVTERVRIPMRAGVESLNASVAAALFIYSALGTENFSEE